MDELIRQQAKEWRNSLTDNQREELDIFNYRIHKLSYENDKEIKNLLEKFELEKKTLITKNDEEKQKIKEEYNNELKITTRNLNKKYKNDIDYKDNQIKEKEIQLQEKDKLMLKLCNKTVKIEKDETKLDLILDAVQSLNRKNKSPQKLGNEGENIIDCIIYKYFENFELINTSKIKNNGDRILNVNDCSILLEIKNCVQNGFIRHYNEYRKQILTDLIISKKDKNINCGILVNVEETYLQNKNFMSYEILSTEEGNIFLLFLTNVKKYDFLLPNSIKLCCVISKLIRENNINEIINFIENNVHSINEIIKEMTDNKKKIEDISKSNEKHIKILLNFIDNLQALLKFKSKDMSHVKKLKICNKNDKELNIIIDIFNELLQKHGKVRTVDLKERLKSTYASYSRVSKLGGIKAILEKYELK